MIVDRAYLRNAALPQPESGIRPLAMKRPRVEPQPSAAERLRAIWPDGDFEDMVRLIEIEGAPVPPLNDGAAARALGGGYEILAKKIRPRNTQYLRQAKYWYQRAENPACELQVTMELFTRELAGVGVHRYLPWPMKHARFLSRYNQSLIDDAVRLFAESVRSNGDHLKAMRHGQLLFQHHINPSQHKLVNTVILEGMRPMAESCCPTEYFSEYAWRLLRSIARYSWANPEFRNLAQEAEARSSVGS